MASTSNIAITMTNLAALNSFYYNNPSSDHAQLKSHYNTHGVLVVRGLVKDPQELKTLSLSADLVTKRTRESQWHYKRTVGKQFPPWNQESQDVWGVQHIMHPDLGQRAFIEFYFSSALLSLVSGLTGSNELMLGLHNLLVEPLEHDNFGLDWHRDSIKASVTELEECALLATHATAHPGVQWNLALYNDECLFVVPGSHQRVRTAPERAAEGTSDTMPDSIQVRLEPGDAVFYNAQILHRASYHAGSKRRTLHGAHLDGRALVSRGGGGGIVQHFDRVGLFFEQDAFRESLRGLEAEEEAVRMVNRFASWCESVKKAKFDGFVQDDV